VTDTDTADTDTTDTPTVARKGMGAVMSGVLVAAVGGLVLGLVIAGIFPDTESGDVEAPELVVTGEPLVEPGPAVVDERVIAPEPAPGVAPGTDVVTATDPAVDEQVRLLLERQAQDEERRAERARLASDSPLTPGVREVADMVRPSEADPAPDATPDVPTADDGGGAPAPPSATDPEPTGHVLARGSIIPAVLESALDSALPGLVRARVSEDVRDTDTGEHILIPRGSFLVGAYRQAGRAGQQRLFVSWSDLRMPDGTPIDLDDFSSLGADGAAGVRGRRSTGLLKALGAAVLLDLAGNATQIITGESTTTDDGDLGALLAAAAGNATTRVSERYLEQILSGGTRFRVAAGAIMNVIVEESLTLPPARRGP